MSQIKGKLTQVEAEADHEEVRRQVPDYRRARHVFDIQSNGVSVDWSNNMQQAVKCAKEVVAPAVVFQINTKTGRRNPVFRNEAAIKMMVC